MLRDQIGRLLPDNLKTAIYDTYRLTNRVRNRLTMRDGVVSLHGVRLRADPDLIGEEVVERILVGDYEGREARMVSMFLEPSDRVIELGAGIGFIGLLCASRLAPGQVQSFEANPMMEEIIRGNYALNDGPLPELTIGLLSEEPGEAVFYIPELFWAASTTPIPDAKTVRTPRISLNEKIRELGSTFLIMDIEGGEIDIIEALEPGSVRKIAMELHPEVTGEDAIAGMTRRLTEMGFTRRWTSNAGQHAYFEAL
ncbi:MAG: FkbM family methyltransferase [Pseudomonadota bacterium]